MNIETKNPMSGPAPVMAQASYLKQGLDAMARYADRVTEVSSLLEKLEALTGTSAKRSVTRLQKELDDFEPAVTFLGQVKSGKTTLVNAMAGWPDLLPSDVNPWTSVVTSLHLQPGGQRADIGASFKFMEEGEWDRLVNKGGRLGELANRAGSDGELESIRHQIETLREKSRARLGKKFEMLLGQEHEYGYFDKNLLERYICIGDDFYEDDADEETALQGRFADITRSADLYLTSSSLPFRMCMRDTPGVNDTFMMREQVTINAVRSSRVCVVVLSAHQALTSVDMALIRMISSLPSRDVLIFVNRIDELSEPAAQIPEIEASIRQVLAEHQGPEDAHIVFGSALWANKVLSDDLDALSQQSADALLAWADAKATTHNLDGTAPEMVWHLSGLPELNRIVSERVVEKIGEPLLERITGMAISVASGQRVANNVRLDTQDAHGSMCLQDVKTELAELAQRHKAALEEDINVLIDGFKARSDRAHSNFVNRATQSLIAHLEAEGDGKVWNYNPTGLRMLLRSAYSVFAARAKSVGEKRYEAAVVGIAELYVKAFGKVVEGIELGVPEVLEFPAPVAIAQTIALDFNDSWWVSWWRRTRGYKAFEKQFHTLVTAETSDFMSQLQTVQTQIIQEQLQRTLDSYFEQNKDIMFEISTSRDGNAELQRTCLGNQEYERLAQLDDLIEALRLTSAQAEQEGQDDEL